MLREPGPERQGRRPHVSWRGSRAPASGREAGTAHPACGTPCAGGLLRRWGSLVPRGSTTPSPPPPSFPAAAPCAASVGYNLVPYRLQPGGQSFTRLCSLGRVPGAQGAQHLVVVSGSSPCSAGDRLYCTACDTGQTTSGLWPSTPSRTRVLRGLCDSMS